MSANQERWIACTLSKSQCHFCLGAETQCRNHKHAHTARVNNCKHEITQQSQSQRIVTPIKKKWRILLEMKLTKSKKTMNNVKIDSS